MEVIWMMVIVWSMNECEVKLIVSCWGRSNLWGVYVIFRQPPPSFINCVCSLNRKQFQWLLLGSHLENRNLHIKYVFLILLLLISYRYVYIFCVFIWVAVLFLLYQSEIKQSWILNLYKLHNCIDCKKVATWVVVLFCLISFMRAI